MKLTNYIDKTVKNEKSIWITGLRIKTIHYLIIALPLLLMACESIPEAHFYTDIVDPEVGQEVLFTNDSHNATDFEWDFGDGYISNDPNPVHYFNASGTFEVVLTAYSKSGLSDQASISINVEIPTLLEIEVLEWYEEYTVADASVRLYPTLVDWQDETNMEAEGFTDGEGVVVFSHLGPYVYYVDVWEQDHDNYTLASESVDFIRTSEIMPHKINRFTAWVDVVDHGKSDGTRDRTLVIKKLERKSDDKSRSVSGDEDWKALYEKSIRLN